MGSGLVDPGAIRCDGCRGGRDGVRVGGRERDGVRVGATG